MRQAALWVLELVRVHGDQEGIRKAAEQGLTQRLSFGELYEVLTADEATLGGQTATKDAEGE